MKLIKASLKGFRGLPYDLDVDFSRDGLNLIIGRNGSGKSTLLSSLTPLREQNDGRNNFILPDGGSKHLVYNIDGITYETIHMYGKENKSYLKINGKIINPNGLIKNYNSLILEHFGLDDSHLKFLKIGSNSGSIIDMTPADRKKFIGNFLPNIDIYLNRFEFVKNKLNDINTKIGYLEQSNIKILNGSTYEDLVIMHQQCLDTKKHLLEKAAYNNSMLEKYNDIIDSDDYKEFLILNKQILDMEKTMIHLEHKESLKKEILSIDNDFTNKEKKLYELNEKINHLNIDINSLTEQKNGFKNKHKYISQSLDESYIVKYDELLEKCNLLKMQSNKMNLSNNLKCLIDTADVKSYCESIRDEYKTIVNNCEIFIKQFGVLYPDDIVKLIEQYSKEHLQLNKLLSLHDDYVSVNDKLNDVLDIVKSYDRPQSHTKTIKGYIDQIREFFLLQIKYDTSLDNKELEHKRKNIENKIMALREYYATSKDMWASIGKIVEKLPGMFTIRSLTDKLNSIPELTEEIKVAVNSIYKYNVIQNDITNTNVLLDNMRDVYLKMKSDKEASSHILLEISNLENRIKDIHATISNLEEAVLEVKNKMESLTRRRTIAMDKLIALDKYIDTSEGLAKLKNKRPQVNMYQVSETVSNIFNDIKEVAKQTKENDSKEMELLFKINSLKDNLDTIKQTSESATPLKAIKDALDIKKGIPTVLIDNYLKDIANYTNDLLSINNSTFNIDFDINEKEFKIIITDVKDDDAKEIKDCSQGEKALIKTALSLAMNKKILNEQKFNSVFIDEIDSELDIYNKESFLNLLNSHLEILGNPQTFIISHNKNFMDIPANLYVFNRDLLKEFDIPLDNKYVVYL